MILKHVIERGHEPVTPTLLMLRRWWALLNAECFGGKLLPCQLSYGKSERADVLGLFHSLENRRGHIHIDTRVNTRGGMLGTLAHEMVHQYQHQHGQPTTHGKAFTRWAKPILTQTGLYI